MRWKKEKTYMADYETTVTGSKSQNKTEVWASAIVQVKTKPDETVDEEVYIDNSMDKFFNRINYISYCDFQKYNYSVYFHNLKFDGSFIIDYLLKNGYETSLDKYTGVWRENKYMSKKSFKCVISDMGQWYSITVKLSSGVIVTFKDSLKLLPFSVATIGKSFDTKHKKTSIEYIGNRHADGIITDEEKDYIKNDVLVVKEALEKFFADGLNKLTIGSCCKGEYIKGQDKKDLENWYPNLYNEKCDIEGYETQDDYIRKAYKGGWCYLKKGSENKLYKNGITADVNSLYPSMMLDNTYPVGKPQFFTGAIPEKATRKNKLFIVRIKCCFNLKKGYLPTIQIKGNPRYNPKEWLETSDIIANGKKYRYIKTLDGKTEKATVTMTLTSVDYYMFLEHYNVEDLEILDGCMFYCIDGKMLFGEYINKWADIKKTSKGAQRQEAKLFLNNLYGKFSTKPDANTKCPYIEDGKVKFKLIQEKNDKKVWYIPIGCFITSYARQFTISHAQQNYDNFIYADTDSIHCCCGADELKGIAVHPTEFSHWALESSWDEAIFVRQKTYIEHCTHENLEVLEKPFYNIKCAGMDKRPKELLQAKLENREVQTTDREEKEFLQKDFQIRDFKVGLKVPSKKMTKRVDGGIVLINSTYEMR